MDLEKEYRVGLDLASGAHLDMLLFSHTDHRWIFDYRYQHPKKVERLAKPDVVNETKLVVNYTDGTLADCTLSMNITRPNNLGQEYFAGVDVSKNAKFYVEFKYEKDGDDLRMTQVDVGATRRFVLDEIEAGLMQPIDFPFPLEERLTKEHGLYQVPFLLIGGEQSSFEFPDNYVKDL